MIEGLAARFFIKQKKILTHIHIICLFFPFVFFFRRCWETEVRIRCHLDCVDVMFQIWYHLITNFPLKLMRFSARHKYLYAFSINCRTYEDERGVSYVSYRQNIEVMLVWPVIM